MRLRFRCRLMQSDQQARIAFVWLRPAAQTCKSFPNLETQGIQPSRSPGLRPSFLVPFFPIPRYFRVFRFSSFTSFGQRHALRLGGFIPTFLVLLFIFAFPPSRRRAPRVIGLTGTLFPRL